MTSGPRGDSVTVVDRVRPTLPVDDVPGAAPLIVTPRRTRTRIDGESPPSVVDDTMRAR